MSNYVKTTDFTSKDTLASGNPLKTIKGTEFDVEFNNIATASATKANIAAPTFTGVPAAPTATLGDNTTQLATTAFVTAAVGDIDHSVYLLKTGGALTGPVTTNSTFDGVDIATRDAVLTNTTATADSANTTANAALPKAGGALTGAVTTNSTFDGVDIATRDAVLTSTTTTADAAQVPPTITGTSVTVTNASYHVVSAGGITLTLPITPSAGNYVIIKDGTGVAVDTPFTVARNGSNIASSATDLTFDKNFAEIVMTYVNGTIGWSV